MGLFARKNNRAGTNQAAYESAMVHGARVGLADVPHLKTNAKSVATAETMIGVYSIKTLTVEFFSDLLARP